MNEEIKKICEYIRTHKPQATKFDTINVAIQAITGNSACVKKDLLNEDDVWLMPEEQREKFAGIKGKGWAQSISPEEIKLIEDAVQYASLIYQRDFKKEPKFPNDINDNKMLDEMLKDNNTNDDINEKLESYKPHRP